MPVNLKNAATHKYMDVPGWSRDPHVGIILYGLKNKGREANQQWEFKFVDLSACYFRIKSTHSGLVLDVPSGNEGTQVLQVPADETKSPGLPHGRPSQIWTFADDWPEGDLSIVHLVTGMLLTAASHDDGARLQLNRRRENDRMQRWHIWCAGTWRDDIARPPRRPGKPDPNPEPPQGSEVNDCDDVRFLRTLRG